MSHPENFTLGSFSLIRLKISTNGTNYLSVVTRWELLAFLRGDFKVNIHKMSVLIVLLDSE